MDAASRGTRAARPRALIDLGLASLRARGAAALRVAARASSPPASAASLALASGPGWSRRGRTRLHRQYLCNNVLLLARTYTASEAAQALGISLDTLRRWDRQGRIRVTRDAANRRLVSAREIDRLRGGGEQTLSARNRLEGVVRDVKIEGLLAEVELDVTRGGRLVAVITRESAESLGLARGMSAKAVVKATSVMVER